MLPKDNTDVSCAQMRGGRPTTNVLTGRDRESRWDNMNFPHSRSGNARNDSRSGDF